MFDRIIVGIDGYDGGRDALSFARTLQPGGLRLISAYPATVTPVPGSDRSFDELLRDDAVRRLEAARFEAGVSAELKDVADTSPARALQREAEAYDADLVVVGSSHCGPVGRVLIGDVSRGVLHGAPCPAAVVPHRFRATSGSLRTVLVAFDGSAESREALHLAARLRDELAGKLLLVQAIGAVSGFNASPLLVGWDRIIARERADAEEGLREAVAEVGGDAQHRIVGGSGGPALVHVSKEADVVVTGSRGWGTLRRVGMGSTSDYLVHHATCPVIVVPRPAVEASVRSPEGARAHARP
jgi:nucleotide-binding universal stress UspA family protein